MNNSLDRLKTILSADKRYTGVSFATNSLEKIRANINTMVDIMNQSRPGDPNSTTGNMSGTTCTGFVNSKYLKPTISIGELENFASSLPAENCTVVVNPGCSCVGRTLYVACDCQNRTTCTCNTVVGCECNVRTVCTCDWRGTCDCNGQCSCHHRIGAKCGSRCGCNTRDSADCPGRTGVECSSRDNTDCATRTTYTCSARSVAPTCPCNGRCSCNTEKRFG